MTALASLLLVAAALPPPAIALSRVMPVENQWAVEGQGLTLECRSDRPFDTCQWAPPGEDTYVVERGFSAEGGRLVYHEGDDDKDTVCAVRVTAAAEKDGGKWKCIVAGTDAEGQIQRASALADVRLATKPSSVTLAHPFHAGHANVTAGATVPVRCSVAGALPAPTAFEWYVGDDEVTGQYETVDDEEAQWAQTLLYTPDRAHANKSLRCKVGHMALQDGDDREAGVVLRFVGGDAADFGSSSVASQSFHEEPYFPVLMVVIVVVLSAVLGLAIYFKCIKPRSAPAATDKDAEAQKGEEVKENDDETKVNNPEEVLNASAASKKSAASAAKEEIKGRAAAFTERVASFFRFGAAGKDEGSSDKGVEKAGDEFVAVDINGGKVAEEEKEGEGKTDATVDADAKEEAEGEQEEENPAAEATTKAGFFRRVLGAFRSAGGKKEEVKMEDTEETAGESEEAESEKKDEEKPVEEEEGDQPVPPAEEQVKKQPPKNTDV